MLLPLCQPYTPPHSIVPVDPSASCHRVMAYKHLDRLVKEFNKAIKEACRKTLKPKHAPNIRDATWWSEECTWAHILACNARDGIDRQEVTKALCMALIKVKKKWAHNRLYEAEDAGDIW